MWLWLLLLVGLLAGLAWFFWREVANAIAKGIVRLGWRLLGRKKP